MIKSTRAGSVRSPMTVLCVLSGLCFLPASFAPAANPPPQAAVGTRVIELVNVARSKSRTCGSVRYSAAPPLKASRTLEEAARRHARDMARNGFFDHRGSDGSQPSDRVRRAGYSSRLTGENIAFGPETAQEVVAGWLASPDHCENIMDPRFEQIGVGTAIGRRRDQVYWVQIFAAPRPARR